MLAGGRVPRRRRFAGRRGPPRRRRHRRRRPRQLDDGQPGLSVPRCTWSARRPRWQTMRAADRGASTSPRGTYINFLEGDERRHGARTSIDPDDLAGIVALRRQLDPDDVLRFGVDHGRTLGRLAAATQPVVELGAVQLGVAAAGGQQLACGVPRSTMRPASTTRIASAARIVDRRWAITSAVRPDEGGDERLLHGGLGLRSRGGRWPRRGSRPVAWRAAAGRSSAAAAHRPTAGSRARRRRCRGRRPATARARPSRAWSSAAHSSSSVAAGAA